MISSSLENLHSSWSPELRRGDQKGFLREDEPHAAAKKCGPCDVDGMGGGSTDIMVC